MPEKNFSLTIFILSCVFLSININIFSVGNYPVTSANIFILLYLLYTTFKINIFSLFATLVAALYFILVALIFSLDSVLDYQEFILSFGLTLISVYVYIYSILDKNTFFKKINFELFLKICIFFIISIEIFQVLEFIILGTWKSWSMFEGLTVPIGTDIHRFEAPNLPGFIRPISLYVEPSYLGMVLILCLVTNDFLQKNIYIKISAIIGIILSLSSISLIVLFIYFVLSEIFRNKKYFKYYLFLVIFLFAVNIGKVLEVIRFDEVLIPGTSGYLRIIEPLLDVAQKIPLYPLGFPLGQSDVIYSNSLFLLILYFGIFSFIIFPIIFYFTYRICSNKEKLIKYWIFIFTLLITSGGIFTIESAFILMIFNTIFILNKND